MSINLSIYPCALYHRKIWRSIFLPLFDIYAKMGNDTGFAEHSSLGYFFYLCFFDAWIYRGGSLPEPVIWDASAGPLPLSIWFFFLSARGCGFVKIYLVFLSWHTMLDCNKIWILQININNWINNWYYEIDKSTMQMKLAMGINNF